MQIKTTKIYYCTASRMTKICKLIFKNIFVYFYGITIIIVLHSSCGYTMPATRMPGSHHQYPKIYFLPPILPPTPPFDHPQIPALLTASRGHFKWDGGHWRENTRVEVLTLYMADPYLIPAPQMVPQYCHK